MVVVEKYPIRSRVTLWKNVDGVFTADPGPVPQLWSQRLSAELDLVLSSGPERHRTFSGLVPDATPVAYMNYDEAESAEHRDFF